LARLALSAGLIAAVATHASAADARTCYGPEDTRAHVAKQRLVGLSDIVRSAGGATDRRELISARLCETNGNFVYIIALLDRNGRVQRITVDARSGDVINHR
jgi:uncharacterized membrane protein YkoI